MKPRWRWYRDTDGALLKVDTSKIERMATCPNGRRQEVFYMYRCYRNGERCQVSSSTLSMLAEVAKMGGK